MSIYKTKTGGILIMVLLIVLGSFIGCFLSLNSMYSNVKNIFENGEDNDGICVMNDLMKRADCAVNMCTVARRYLSGTDASLTDTLSDASGKLKNAGNISAMKKADDELEYAMKAVYDALESDTSVTAQDEKLYAGLYAEFKSRGDTIQHDAYNTAASEYNEKTAGVMASVVKKITPAKEAVVFY
jgi:hypothetical protein